MSILQRFNDMLHKKSIFCEYVTFMYISFSNDELLLIKIKQAFLNYKKNILMVFQVVQHYSMYARINKITWLSKEKDNLIEIINKKFVHYY